MMKKLLVLMLVLGMASLANADLQISVNGNKNPADSQYMLLPSQTLSLDIWTDALIEPGVGEGYWAMVAQTSHASITGGVVLPVDEGIVIMDWDPEIIGPFPGTLPGEKGVTGGIALTRLTSIEPDTTIYDEILFHCEAPGDVTIRLLWTTDFETSALVDSVVIHQIVPEPATITLLGFGGLLLRRRRRK